MRLAILPLLGLAACGGGLQLAKASPALLGEDMKCRSAAGEKLIDGYQWHTVQGLGWTWIQRRSEFMDPGIVGKVDMRVDPTLWYEAAIGAGDAGVTGGASDASGLTTVTVQDNGTYLGVDWNATAQSNVTLQWGQNGAPGTCVYVLILANQKSRGD